MFVVLIPSEKSWVNTAIATTMPMAREAWNARPMATPSSKLWQHSTPAATLPRGADAPPP